jgi:hypothetical protein
VPSKLSRTQLSVREQGWITKWKDRFEIEKTFSPANWGYVALSPRKAYGADVPSLVNTNKVYGPGVAQHWLQTQITGLFLLSPSSDAKAAERAGAFAEVFYPEVRAFKLSELMLFFARYAAGKYDKSFTLFSPHRIGNAFFTEFLPDRKQELQAFEHDKEEANREAERRKYQEELKRIPEGYTPYTWWKEQKLRKEQELKNK